ncbi:MAG: FAD-dependent oxidoreductase [Pseudomonadota bacterium]
MTKTTPFWWEDAGAPAAPPPADLPAEADVVVVGAGLTGASAARTLARAGSTVLVLDAGAPGIGASSRNGGMIGGGHRLSPEALRDRYGEDLARRLLHEAHVESLAFCRTLMAEERIDPDFRQTGRFRGFWAAREYEATARAIEALARIVPLDYEMIPRSRQHEETGSTLYRGGVVFPAHGGLNPAKWVKGILAAAARHGALVQGDTPVTAIAREGGRFRVATPRGTIRAGQVLMATNGYTPAAVPALRRRIVPVPSFIIATEPLGANRMKALFPKGRMTVESRERHCYYRPSPAGDRIVFGGRAAMLDAPEHFVQRELRGLLAQIFPDLGPVALSHSWRGFTGFTFETLPHVGQDDGLWHAMGYSGSGNAMAPWLGHKTALAMLGDPAGDTAFARTRFETRWWHRGRAWFMPAAEISLRLRDIRANHGRDAEKE